MNGTYIHLEQAKSRVAEHKRVAMFLNTAYSGHVKQWLTLVEWGAEDLFWVFSKL